VESTVAEERRLRLRLVAFLVSRWLLKALLRRIVPFPDILNLFFALEFVFSLGIFPEIWSAKVEKINE
jgi:hypothetical protein